MFGSTSSFEILKTHWFKNWKHISETPRPKFKFTFEHISEFHIQIFTPNWHVKPTDVQIKIKNLNIIDIAFSFVNVCAVDK